MIRENATKILILLSFENLTLYKISKYLAKFNGPQSNGTISPILKNLVSEGYIKFSRAGAKKGIQPYREGQAVRVNTSVSQ
jgi:hypothetical protein